MTDTPTPLLKRLKINTVAAPDIGVIESWYTEWLEYSVCERGTISAGLAASWGAPAMTDRPYILMKPESGDDAYLRAVEIDAVPGYKPMNTLGWNAFELIIDDVYALNKKLLNSPFKIIGEPASLGGDLAFIHAMQVEGPAGDILYLTCDRVRASDSLLPPAGAFIGRPFIVILAGNGVEATQRYYSETFSMKREDDMQTGIGVVADAQGLPEGHIFDMGFMALADTGNFIEYDGYADSFSARPQTDGQLPPGCSTVSITVSSLDGLNLDFVGEAVSDPSMAYGGGRTRTARGPVGELIELIEES
ncbi:MAG: hypothetical protein ACKVKT_01510 [Rhodospirillales bacterium]|jgi:hypothetical protein